jgi:hypothetical protein
MEYSYKNRKTSKNILIDFSLKLWVDKEKLEKCLETRKYKSKIENDIKNWSKYFEVYATPTSILINNITWEYIILVWAHPKEEFDKQIWNLLVNEEYFNENLNEITKKISKNTRIKLEKFVKKLNEYKKEKLKKQIIKIREKIKNKSWKKIDYINNILNYLEFYIQKMDYLKNKS